MALVPGGPDTDLITGILNGDTANVTFGRHVWVAQCFTLDRHYLAWRCAAKLGFHTVTPKYLEYGIRYTLAGKPDGPDMDTTRLLHGPGHVAPGGLWWPQNFPIWPNLGDGEWALVIRVPTADAPWLWWARATETLPPGITGKAWKSTNSGVDWTEVAGYFLLHQVWGTPRVTPIPPPKVISNWAPLDYTHEATPTGFQVQPITDIPVHLWMRYSFTPPRKHKVQRYKRGIAMPWNTYYCFTAWKELEQDEPGDTLEHTFTFNPWPICQTRWFYFTGSKRLYPTPSASPIYELHRTEEYEPPTGSIIGELDQLEFDPLTGAVPKLIYIAPNTYAIVYQGSGNDGWLKTIAIDDDGVITGIIQTFEFDPVYGRMPSICHVHANIYAIAYSTVGQHGLLITLTINPDGSIGPILSSHTFEPGYRANYPQIRHVSDTTYSIWYSGPDNDGWLKTIEIHDDGLITGVIRSLEFDLAYANYPSPHHISGTVWACAYQAQDYAGPGRIFTLTISPTGTIGPIITTRDFDPTYASRPDLFHILASTYAIAYRGPDYHGILKTMIIDNAGNIGSTIAQLHFDPAHADYPSATPVGDDVWAIAYQGPDYDAWLRTIQIDPSGTIPGEVDNYEYDAERGSDTNIIHVHGNTYASAYCGPDYDGWLKTIGIHTPT